MRPAAAEGDVIVGLAGDVEPQRVGELLLVEVGRDQPGDDLVALADADAVQLGVGRGRAAEVDHGRAVAHDLVGGGAHQLGLLPQPLHRLRVVHQRLHAVGDRLARGLVAGHDQQQEHGVELLLGQPVAVLVLPHHQLRDQVVGGMLAPLTGDLVAVVVELHGVRAAERVEAVLRALRAGRVQAAQVGIGVSDHLVAPRDQPLVVGQRHAQDPAQHLDRQLLGDLLDEVELAPGQRLVQDLACEVAQQLLVGGHRPRREALVYDRAQARVLGRVGVQHRLASLDLVGVEVLERRRAGLRREGAPVLQHGHHVVVAGDAPEPLAVLPVVPVHRRLVAHQRERLVRDPLRKGVVV